MTSHRIPPLQVPVSPEGTASPEEIVIAYHESTKHHFHRYARSLGYLDWDTQPNPFRFYEGARSLKLPFVEKDPGATYMNLYERIQNPVRSFTLENLSLFLELSLGISAWKSIPGASWALRMNPSSGNLHPTEGYVIIYQEECCDPGIYHYSPFLHALECRADLPADLAERVKGHFQSAGFLFVLTSIFWREAWKYGERAFRYCNHDVGHAIASASFAANLLGWKVTYLNEVSDEDISQVLGFHKTRWGEYEQEHPEVLCYVHPSNFQDFPKNLSTRLIAHISELPFRGDPNRLSGDHLQWEIISEVARATWKPTTKGKGIVYPERPFVEMKGLELTAAQIIRKRRSAVAFNGVTSITKEQLVRMLDKTLPRKDCAPFDFALGLTRVHLLLFIHRVIGLPSGLYMFVRDLGELKLLRILCRADFLWEGINEKLPLYFLGKGLLTREATAASCHQPIAGDSSFSLGMIAKFRPVIEEAPFLYRHLFWETGMIGQVLYLEAEAGGVRGTGIGCFFDDAVHEIMGLKNNDFQSLYHFTIGGPVEDERLQTWPPYYHLKNNMTDPSKVVHFDRP